eukprot:6182651-Pleurochrysis_carterae.AAC.4
MRVQFRHAARLSQQLHEQRRYSSTSTLAVRKCVSSGAQVLQMALVRVGERRGSPSRVARVSARHFCEGHRQVPCERCLKAPGDEGALRKWRATARGAVAQRQHAASDSDPRKWQSTPRSAAGGDRKPVKSETGCGAVDLRDSATRRGVERWCLTLDEAGPRNAQSGERWRKAPDGKRWLTAPGGDRRDSARRQAARNGALRWMVRGWDRARRNQAAKNGARRRVVRGWDPATRQPARETAH